MSDVALGSGSLSIHIGSFSGAAAEAGGVAVVIDVFKAFTTAAVAFANGAGQIIMVGDPSHALELRSSGVGKYCMGEYNGCRPEGFDFGNSPTEIASQRFHGETLIQTTSNGTRGVLAAAKARLIFAGALSTAEATVRAIQESGDREISLIAMGVKDRIRTEEDEVCALYLRARLLGRHPDKYALKALVTTMSSRSDSAQLDEADIVACLTVDAYDFAIRVQHVDNYYIACVQPPRTPSVCP